MHSTAPFLRSEASSSSLLPENRQFNLEVSSLNIPVDQMKAIQNINTLISELALEKEELMQALLAESSESSTLKGLCTGSLILLTSGGRSSHVLVFSEDLLFIYLLPPIIFNARCSFDVLTSDGSLHEVEISQDPSASVFSAHTSNNNSTLKEFPENVFCLNYHPETSLLAIVGGAVSAPVTSSGNTGK